MKGNVKFFNEGKGFGFGGRIMKSKKQIIKA